MEQELLTKLIGIVENVAPELWRIAMRQVTAEIAGGIVWLIALVSIGIFLGRMIPRLHRKLKEADDFSDAGTGITIGLVVSYIVAFIVPIIVVVIAARLIESLISPEYAALRVLLRLVSQ